MLPASASDSPSPGVRHEEPHHPTEGHNRYDVLVARILQGDDSAVAEFYEITKRGLMYFFYRQFGATIAQDLTHEAILIALKAIRKGQLREPSKLGAFIQSIARNLVRAEIDKCVTARNRVVDIETPGLGLRSPTCPELEVEESQRASFVRSVLAGLDPHDHEILTRFYFLEQPADQICVEMGLTETQYRLLKSQAKAKFGNLGKRTLNRRALPVFAAAG